MDSNLQIKISQQSEKHARAANDAISVYSSKYNAIFSNPLICYNYNNSTYYYENLYMLPVFKASFNFY